MQEYVYIFNRNKVFLWPREVKKSHFLKVKSLNFNMHYVNKSNTFIHTYHSLIKGIYHLNVAKITIVNY